MRMKAIGIHYIHAWNCLELCLANKHNIFSGSHTFVHQNFWELEDAAFKNIAN